MFVQLERDEYRTLRAQMLDLRDAWMKGYRTNLYPFSSKQSWQLGLVRLRQALAMPCKATAENVCFWTDVTINRAFLDRRTLVRE